VCAHFPYPIKIWLNGHEYAKRAAAVAGMGFTELDNGFASTDEPASASADSLGSGVIRGVLRALVGAATVAADRGRPAGGQEAGGGV
jgi:hypothetical protein